MCKVNARRTTSDGKSSHCLWQGELKSISGSTSAILPCLFTDRDEIRNLYRGLSIDASYQVLLHLAKWFQRRIFFLIDQSETIIFSGGHVCYRIRTKCALLIENLPQMLPFKVRFIWPRYFQKYINQRKELFVAAIYVRRSRRNEQSLQSIFHICFLSSFSSFG